MSGPLSGLRVIDLCSVVSGPLAATILADQGADVIKVESLRGDQMRRGRDGGGFAPTFISCNRGKRSIALNLKDEQGKAVLSALLGDADVLLQNFRPGAMGRLGFGAEEVLKAHPSLIYASISGVGDSGPYAGKRIYDPMIQSLSGLADIQADTHTGRPRMTRTIIVDKTTAIYAAQAITAALVRRGVTGLGQHVRISMLDTMVSLLWPEGMSSLTLKSEGDEVPPTSHHDMIFETSNGYITVGTVSDAEWRGLCGALGRPEWIDDARFSTNALRNKNREERLNLISQILRTRTREEWVVALDAADVPCMPVLRRREVLDDPQVKASETIVEFEHPFAGEIRQARPAARFSESPAHSPRPAPRLGEHTVAVLQDAGFDDDRILALRDAGVVGVLDT
jgi:crotonobetainyl-CoA:carnitine CoA-transferase CaiB-like acyl-CoA transferase